ncbi:MAG TPA: hypothetical protein PKX15_08865 [Bacteroidales bacterium]|nr:hypothetical protein [Bacteroidales bacterium]
MTKKRIIERSPLVIAFYATLLGLISLQHKNIQVALWSFGISQAAILAWAILCDNNNCKK